MTCYAMACRRKTPCTSHRKCERTWHACSVNTQTNVIPPDADLVHHIYHWRCGDCEDTWTLSQDGKWYRD